MGDLSAWLFDEERTYGDWNKFEANDGVYYFWVKGEGVPYLNWRIGWALCEERLQAVVDAATEAAVYDEAVAMRADVAIYGN